MIDSAMVEYSRHPNGIAMSALIPSMQIALGPKFICDFIEKNILDKLADKWIEEHGQEVLELIRPKAVALLAVPHLAKKIGERG